MAGRRSATRKTADLVQPSQQKASLPSGYREFLDDLKTRIRTAQVKAALAVNSELIRLYWDIGGMIAERQKTEGWGKSVVERLAADIQHEFPGVAGFSVQNIWKMRAFYLAWTDQVRNLSQAVREMAGKANLSQPVREMRRLRTCRRPWRKSRGGIIPSFSSSSRIRCSASGTPAKPSSTAGRGRCSCTGSSRTCTRARARP